VAIGTRPIFANRKAYSSAPFSRTLSFFWGPCIASTRRKRSLLCSASITRPWRQPLFCGVPSPLRPVVSIAAQAHRTLAATTLPQLSPSSLIYTLYVRLRSSILHATARATLHRLASAILVFLLLLPPGCLCTLLRASASFFLISRCYF